MTFWQQLKTEAERTRTTPNRLIYLGNEPRPYGINEQDTWGMDHYIAATIANGLRMLVAYGVSLRDEETYERIASKLEFYACDHTTALYENIDWSNDKIESEDRSAWPGINEYSEKSDVIDYWRYEYMREALEWVTEHFGELWD